MRVECRIVIAGESCLMEQNALTAKGFSYVGHRVEYGGALSI